MAHFHFVNDDVAMDFSVFDHQFEALHDCGCTFCSVLVEVSIRIYRILFCVYVKMLLYGGVIRYKIGCV